MNEWIAGLPKMIGNYEFAIKGIDYPVPAFLGKIIRNGVERFYV